MVSRSRCIDADETAWPINARTLWVYTQPDLLDAIHTARDGRARPRMGTTITPATGLLHDSVTVG